MAIDTPIKTRFYLERNHSKGHHFCLDVDLQIPESGISVIYGASGSGKTTLLRCIAGLEKPIKGLFRIGLDIWQDDKIFLPAHQRPVGYVFQEASLFSHLTTKQNLDYAIKRASNSVLEHDYQSILGIMDINQFLDVYPNNLSGGEQQRVAIARALLTQPKILLMDEPLSALDSQRKSEIMPYLEKLTQNLEKPLPIIYVTHSLDEVSRLADHIFVMQQGKLIKQGKLQELLPTLDHHDTTSNDKLGVVFKCRVIQQDDAWHLNKVVFEKNELWVHDNNLQIGDHLRVRILAKDISIALSNHLDSSILNRLNCEIAEINSDKDDAYCLVKLKLNNCTLIAQLTNKSVANLKLAVGMKVWAQIKSVAIID
ncbi:MAG: molybdenum ABC transporter ATP-binding protein [Enterobacterales bacterium]|nr:molybdenum ABC transporter ATP-binding protein [Enterobacterales bacterium]